MELTHAQIRKAGGRGKLVDDLRKANPDTFIRNVKVLFPQVTDLPEGEGEDAFNARRAKMREALDAAIKPLKELGLNIDNEIANAPSAYVSGPAEKIVAMLDLPGVEMAGSTIEGGVRGARI